MNGITLRKKRQLQKLQGVKVNDWEFYTTVYWMGERHGEGNWMKNKPSPGIIRIDKDTYKVIRTGEIRRFEKNEGKQADFIRKSMKNLERIIKTNFDTVRDKNNAIFITLTYAENMQDPVRLYKDFEHCVKRIKRDRKGHKLEYVAVAEPQERGAWHLHVLMKSDQPVLFIDHSKMDKLWGHGATTTVRLKSDDVGCYYTAYFKSLEVLADDKDRGKYRDDSMYDSEGKQYKKGQRLHFYPKGMQFFRCSRGIKRPVVEKNVMKLDMVEKYGKQRAGSAYALTEVEVSPNGKTTELNVIKTEYFKKP